MAEKGLNIERAREVLQECSPEELRSIRGIINGKLSHRTITPEQHKAMTEAKMRKRKKA